MNDEKEMPGFMTYREVALMFTLLPKEDAADVIQASCIYYLYGKKTELSGLAQQALDIEIASIDRGKAAYQKKREGARNRQKKKSQDT